MSLWKIAWRSIQQRGVASCLTALSMALGVALVVVVLVVIGVVDQSFRRSADGYELIVGAKGGKLQLVLNTVYHLSTPIENIPWEFYQEFITVAGPDGETRVGQYAPLVQTAIPYCLGDNYQGYRVVGTVPDMFERFEFGPGRKYRFAAGRNFKHEHFFEAVVGSVVAAQTGLKIGDHFQPTHGVTTLDGEKHDAFEVVGVLAPTGTPNDRAVFVNMEGFYLLDGHAKLPPEDDAAEAKPPVAPPGAPPDQPLPLPDNQREVTAILVRTNPLNMLAGMHLAREINKGQVAQAVYPQREIYEFLEGVVGNIQLVLLVLAVLIVVVAGIGILVSMYNSMNDRRREIAVMRSLGASRRVVLSVVLLEALMLALGGGVLGFLIGHGMMGVLNPFLVHYTGVQIGFLQFPWVKVPLMSGTVVDLPVELLLIPGLVALAALVGFLPAIAAYRTDVAKALSASP